MANIMDTLIQNGSFASLVNALEISGVSATLRGSGPYTIFAPTEAAIVAMPNKQFFKLQDDPAKLTKALNFHIVSGQYSAADLMDYHFLKTLEGQRLRIASQMDDVAYSESDASDGYGYVMGGVLSVAVVQTITVNKSVITQPDIAADNGFIHAIDQVLTPALLDLTTR
jgi:uncharacterized surface protein with fasciclin (FAS1) repeats